MDANLTGQALLTLDPSAKRYAAQKLDLRVDGKLPGAEAKSLSMRGNLAFNGQKSALDLSALEVLFQGEITDPRARDQCRSQRGRAQLSMDPHKSQLQIEKLAVRGAAWPTARLNSLLTRPRSIFPRHPPLARPDRPRARGRPGRQLRPERH